MPTKTGWIALIGYDAPFVMPEWVPAYFSARGCDFAVRNCQTPDEAARFASGAATVMTSSARPLLTGPVIYSLDGCRAIVRVGSGVDCIDLAGATACGIPVVNTPDALADAVAEHTVALLLAGVHHIPAYDRLVKQGRWQERALVQSQRVRGKTFGLIGFGRIARQVVTLLANYDMAFLAHDPFVATGEMAAVGVQPCSLHDLLAQSDFISLHAPLTASTDHLIGAAELQMMKPNAILVNTARARLVDQAALTQALREGWIGGAALDVIDPEPPLPRDPLLEIDNVVITPHTAAFSEEVRDRMYLAGCEAALAILRGDLAALSIVNAPISPWWATDA